MLQTWARECLGEQVSRHVLGAEVFEREFVVFDSFANKVEMNVDVFSAGVEGVVLGERDRGAVVAVERERMFSDVGVDDVGENIP